MDLPRLLLLTDRSQLHLGRSLVRTVAECVEVGVTHVVVRELDLPEAARTALVTALLDVGATVLSARTLLPGAAGVHLPEAIVPDEKHHFSAGSGAFRPGLSPWGRSCHAPGEVERAAEEGAGWAFLSPYAEGGSKPGRDPLPAAAFAGHPIPVFALGGVTPANAASALAAGAHGVAVMGAVMGAAEPAAVASALLEAVA
jgi:thiamine-phosphate pyrophosphorylase